ncbi:MAG: efflux RND transporter periplasmic adaptor subunit [Duganella sp.]
MTLLRVSSLMLSLPLCIVLLSGCNAGGDQTSALAAPPPVPVEPLVVAARAQTLTENLPGRIVPVRVAEVRARVAGIVQKRHFTEGAVVSKGDLLFSIDPAPLEAALARATAAQARTQAAVKQAQSLLRRYQPLVQQDAVSQQEYDDAVAALATAQANQVVAEADIRTARLDLGYATVRAPLSGRIGKSLVSEGSLVGQGETTPMALIQQTDPVYADFTQPANTVLHLREALADGKLVRGEKDAAAVSITVDGSRHVKHGKLLFSDITVDPGTGQVTLRAEFANADGMLLPGMYVRGNAEMGMDKQAIFVPQRAILRGTDGAAKVMLVSSKNLVEERLVQTGVMQAGEWQIISGLKPGERLIVHGVDKIAPGTAITVTAPAKVPAAATPAPAAALAP